MLEILSFIGLGGLASGIAGFGAGYLAGVFVEKGKSRAKIKAVELRIIGEINEAGHEKLAQAIRARRAAERDWVRGSG